MQRQTCRNRTNKMRNRTARVGSLGQWMVGDGTIPITRYESDGDGRGKRVNFGARESFAPLPGTKKFRIFLTSPSPRSKHMTEFRKQFTPPGVHSLYKQHVSKCRFRHGSFDAARRKRQGRHEWLPPPPPRTFLVYHFSLSLPDANLCQYRLPQSQAADGE